MLTEEAQENKEQQKSPIKAIIFDLDGLLVDSEPIWHAAYEIFLKNHGVVNKPEVYKKMIGRGLRENMVIARDELGVKGDVEELLGEIRGIFYSLLSSRRDVLMQGVIELLQKLDSYKLPVATGGHTKDKCSQILKNIGIDKYFDVVVSSDDVDKGKPAPDVYLETIRQLGLSSKGCLVLEDAVNGVVAAKSAGIKVFGVNSNEKIQLELKKAGADKVFVSLGDIEL